MANTLTATMRSDPESEEETPRILAPLGLNPTDAVSILLKTAVRENGLPFGVRICSECPRTGTTRMV